MWFTAQHPTRQAAFRPGRPSDRPGSVQFDPCGAFAAREFQRRRFFLSFSLFVCLASARIACVNNRNRSNATKCRRLENTVGEDWQGLPLRGISHSLGDVEHGVCSTLLLCFTRVTVYVLADSTTCNVPAPHDHTGRRPGRGAC